jgi:hypothetical protein
VVVISNDGVYIFNRLSLQLVNYLENIYPISNGIIFKNDLYFHDNKHLYRWNLEQFTLQKYFLKTKDINLKTFQGFQENHS